MATFPGGGSATVAHGVTYDSATGLLYADGVSLGSAPLFLYAAAVAAIATLSNVVIIVTDVQSVGSDSGSLWKGNVAGTLLEPWGGSRPIYTLATMPAAAGRTNWRIRVSDYGTEGADLRSNGTQWNIDAGRAQIYRKGDATNAIIFPAATFISAYTIDNNGGNVRITGAGAHGLTTAVAITAGASYISITGCTNMTAGLYLITALDTDTTGVKITINQAYSASITVTAITLANGADTTLLSVTIPPLTPNGSVIVDCSWQWTNDAGTVAKNPAIKLGGTVFSQPSASTAASVAMHLTPLKIQNRNNQLIQLGNYASASAVGSLVGGVPASGAVDTTIATTMLFTGKPANANIRMWLDSVLIEVTT